MASCFDGKEYFNSRILIQVVFCNANIHFVCLFAFVEQLANSEVHKREVYRILLEVFQLQCFICNVNGHEFLSVVCIVVRLGCLRKLIVQEKWSFARCLEKDR
jgi:hypothetical protein